MSSAAGRTGNNHENDVEDVEAGRKRIIKLVAQLVLREHYRRLALQNHTPEGVTDNGE